tara:strand:+ start:222719 stop:223489 length:771 start_codon:yes stop_codon:yes gene_type:complete
MQGSSIRLHFDPEWRITLFVVVLVPVMIGLGLWQLQRAEEKAALSAAFEQRQAQAPTPITTLFSATASELMYLPVSLRGDFLPGVYFLLDNRMYKGRFGYEVLGVLQLPDNGGAVLVNRGWIAGDPGRVNLPDVPAIAGPVELTGHVYVSPGSPYLLAEQQFADGWPKRIQAVEMDKLPTVLGEDAPSPLFPYVVRIDSDAPAALTVDWQFINASPQKHQGYAVQWFTMATVLFIFYILRCSNLWQWLMARTRGAN